MKPLKIEEFSDTALSISWDDGHQSIYLYEDLRKVCPCASCDQIRKSSQKKVPFKRTIPISIDNTTIKPRSIEQVGLYAVRFNWSDGHNTGLYTFELLRELCTCEECANKVSS
jgi:DUF971 family protein